MYDVREQLKEKIMPLLSEDILGVSVTRDDGVSIMFVSKDILITQQTVQPLASINNIVKYVHSELTGDEYLKTTPEKLYVYISGDKHDYLIYPVNHSLFLIFFVKNMDENKLNTLIFKIKGIIKDIQTILK